MHMADALVSPVVSGIMYTCSALAIGYSIKKAKIEDDQKKVPVMGVMGAFVFAAQMINFSIPGTGSSGHLCGGLLLSAVLGPFEGFLTLAAILIIQCFMFADGGILALGCNIWNMAFYGCFVGGLIIWKIIMKNGISKRKIFLASIIGNIISLQLGAFSVTIETFLSGITELPFYLFVSAMQPIHIVIGLIEGLITSGVLCFIYDSRPEILWNYNNKIGEKHGKFKFKNVVIILMVLSITIGTFLSLIASSNPDGLEWSIEKLTGDTNLNTSGVIYEFVERLQNITALLPDYSFKNSDSVIGTSVSGFIGCIIVIFFCVFICYLFRFIKRKTNR